VATALSLLTAQAEIKRADAVIHLQDAREADDELSHEITRRLPARAPVLKVFNKLDLTVDKAPEQPTDQTFDSLSGPATARHSDTAGGAAVPHDPAHGPVENLYISAKTGQNLDTLRQRLLAIAGWSPGAQSPWLARERHVRALEAAEAHLAVARSHAELNDQVLDLFAEELRLAHEELGAITGQFSSDDLLGEIFSSFCIGK